MLVIDTLPSTTSKTTWGWSLVTKPRTKAIVTGDVGPRRELRSAEAFTLLSSYPTGLLLCLSYLEGQATRYQELKSLCISELVDQEG